MPVMDSISKLPSPSVHNVIKLPMVYTHSLLDAENYDQA